MKIKQLLRARYPRLILHCLPSGSKFEVWGLMGGLTSFEIYGSANTEDGAWQIAAETLAGTDEDTLLPRTQTAIAA
jgi:hypothetical protein